MLFLCYVYVDIYFYVYMGCVAGLVLFQLTKLGFCCYLSWVFWVSKVGAISVEEAGILLLSELGFGVILS